MRICIHVDMPGSICEHRYVCDARSFWRTNASVCTLHLVAVKELLDSHNMDIYKTTWFLDYGSLS